MQLTRFVGSREALGSYMKSCWPGSEAAEYAKSLAHVLEPMPYYGYSSA